MPVIVEQRTADDVQTRRRWFAFLGKAATERHTLHVDRQIYFPFIGVDPIVYRGGIRSDDPGGPTRRAAPRQRRHNWAQNQYLIWDIFIEPLAKGIQLSDEL